MKILYGAFLLLPLMACSSGSKLSGDTKQAAAEPAPSGDSTATKTATAPADNVAAAPPSCDKDKTGLTTAKILSNGISTNGEAQSIKYELSVISCKDGSAVPINNAAIAFDLNATIDDISSSSDYVISDASNQVIAQGTLKSVYGSDLFGNVGDYGHWETSNVSFSVAVEKLILEIKIGPHKIQPYKDGDTQIPSYLKIGDAGAVTANLNVIN